MALMTMMKPQEELSPFQDMISTGVTSAQRVSLHHRVEDIMAKPSIGEKHLCLRFSSEPVGKLRPSWEICSNLKMG